MKLIPLTRGLFAQVDDEDYDWLMQKKWYATKVPNTFYAKGAICSKNKVTTLMMHRMILSAPKGIDVDHKDRNGLNNQRNNIRLCTRVQNNVNRKAAGRSKYLGVYFHRYNKPYGSYEYITAAITFKGKLKCLGTFSTEELAAEAHDIKAFEYYGEFANLNFPEKIEYKLQISIRNENLHSR
jgi:hypothetical protein